MAAFVADLISPSRSVWLLSPWISDIPVVDNRGGEVLGLIPGAPIRYLTLCEILRILAAQGTRVTVVVRDERSNDSVVARLAEPRSGTQDEVRVVRVENLHDKGFLTDHVYFEGSMNFTHYGQTVNEEGVSIHTDADLLGRMRLDFEARFRGGV
jgi:phosphatidylserine/phosphatidylglycerophosphate/cardiolipin synthase-like enzyme